MVRCVVVMQLMVCQRDVLRDVVIVEILSLRLEEVHIWLGDGYD